MMKYLQKLGKALMLPVAVLPICGIPDGVAAVPSAPGVMGVRCASSGAACTVGFLLVKAGGALIDNMAWLFHRGAAVGLTKQRRYLGSGRSGRLPDDAAAAEPRRGGHGAYPGRGTATYIAFRRWPATPSSASWPLL